VNAAEWSLLKTKDAWYFDVGVVGKDKVYLLAGDQGNHFGIESSSDGGENWEPIQLSFFKPALTTSFDFNSKGEGVLGVTNFFKPALGYASDDKLEFNPINCKKTIITDVTAVYSHPAVETTFIATGAFGRIAGVAVSEDSGKSFKYVKYGHTLPARYAAFPSKDVWYVTGGKFDDGNDTVSYDYRNTFRAHMNTLQYIAGYEQSEGVEQGYQGVPTASGCIMKTTDGGKTWENVMDEPEKFYVNEISCTDDNTCWATVSGIGPKTINGGAIMHTTDGGKTWTQQKYMFGAVMYPIHMFNNNEGYAAYGVATSPTSGDGFILHTTDGGKTWDTETKTQELVPISMKCVGDSLCYMPCQPAAQDEKAGCLKLM
jgi:hypothetical protein